MHISVLSLLSAGLLLGGCVVQQPQPTTPFSFGAYSAPGYSFAESADPGDQSYLDPDGLTYADGQPVTMLDGGDPAPVFYDPGLGGWGYYDHAHHFHGAPPDMRDRLNRFHPGGRGLLPPGSFHPGPGGLPPIAVHGEPGGAFHGGLGAPPPGAFRGGPALPFANGFHGGLGAPALGGFHGGPGQLGMASAPPGGGSHAAPVL
jgi:hypothetical protein